MPVSAWKNSIYRAALPIFGLHTTGQAACSQLSGKALQALERIFRRHRVVGGCLQIIQEGRLGPLVTYGHARLPEERVFAGTFFRIASISKMVTATGAMALAEKGVLDLDAPVEAYLPYPVRNPKFPDKPVLLRHLLSHTSSLWDGPGYDRALHAPVPLSALLGDARNYLNAPPGSAFRYCNLAAGMLGSIMEAATKKPLEALMQDIVFAPLKMQATYTLKTLADIGMVSCSYRVLPPGRGTPVFDPQKRLEAADDLMQPLPEYHYLPAAGNLITDAASLGRFLCMMIGGGSPILSPGSINKMQAPAAAYGKGAPYTSHGLGLVILQNPGLKTRRLYGHQGFAYGAAECVFYEEGTGNGFVFLNSGASEARRGHLALINRDLIRFLLAERKA